MSNREPEIGAYYRDLSNDTEFRIVGKFKSHYSSNILYVRQYDYNEGCDLKNFLKHDSMYTEILSTMDLDDKYTFYYGTFKKYFTLLYSKVKDTKLARKMAKKIHKEESGWLYVEI